MKDRLRLALPYAVLLIAAALLVSGCARATPPEASPPPPATGRTRLRDRFGYRLLEGPQEGAGAASGR